MRHGNRDMINLGWSLGRLADRAREEQREQRRLYVALAATMCASFLFGWAVCEVFTIVNAARIAGGW